MATISGATAEFTEIWYAELMLCAGDDESVTTAVTWLVPIVVGVPEKTPFEAKVIPGGSPAGFDHLYGPVPPETGKTML